MDTVTANWQGLPGDALVKDRLFKEIVSKYSGRNRHYHNLKHIEALLHLSERYPLRDRKVVLYAIFYHDIIYNVLRKDNETRSAALAVKRLHELGVDADTIALVKHFIEATQTHQATGNPDLELFLDFDMSILGAPWNEYLVYTQQVRKEYKIYPWAMYQAGRKKFLMQCLQAAHIFHSGVFRAGFEFQARSNIQAELDLLD
jgi:predicted metal-dependent HD superfamily phosphohydrolase